MNEYHFFFREFPWLKLKYMLILVFFVLFQNKSLSQKNQAQSRKLIEFHYSQIKDFVCANFNEKKTLLLRGFEFLQVIWYLTRTSSTLLNRRFPPPNCWHMTLRTSNDNGIKLTHVNVPFSPSLFLLYDMTWTFEFSSCDHLRTIFLSASIAVTSQSPA